MAKPSDVTRVLRKKINQHFIHFIMYYQEINENVHDVNKIGKWRSTEPI